MAEEALDARVIGGLVAANPELAARLLETKIKTRERRQLSCVAALLAAVCVHGCSVCTLGGFQSGLSVTTGPQDPHDPMGTLTTHIFKNAISNQPRSVGFRDRKNLRTEGFYGSGFVF